MCLRACPAFSAATRRVDDINGDGVDAEETAGVSSALLKTLEASLGTGPTAAASSESVEQEQLLANVSSLFSANLSDLTSVLSGVKAATALNGAAAVGASPASGGGGGALSSASPAVSGAAAPSRRRNGTGNNQW